jgi:hypothetical protein
VFAGTITADPKGFELDIDIDSDDEPERVAAVIRNAEGGCFAHKAIEQPVPLRTVARVNGAEFDHVQYPRKVDRRR